MSGPHILIVGGGYVGMYTALRLQKRLKLSQSEARVTVVNPTSYMTYQPFLPEAAAGNIEPRHTVVPLRRVLRDCRIVNGWVTSVNHSIKEVTVQPLAGEDITLNYDLIVVAPGSVSRTLPIPGLAQEGIGFKSVGESTSIRNHVLTQMDAAASTDDPALRAKHLTFMVIGGGYAGVELLAEMEDLTRDAIRFYPQLTVDDLRWVLIEASGRILPEVGAPLGEYTVRELEKRNIEVRLNTRVASMANRHVVLSDGEEFDADTIVWTAGVKPHPMLEATDFPLTERKTLKATTYLTIDGLEDAFTAGDCASVPDLSAAPGTFCGPSAQHAVRQSKILADNIVASLRGATLTQYKHKYAGSVASLGLHKGVASIYGIKLKGYPAWLMHRTYHLSRVPTVNRKARVTADWTLALFFRREIVSLGELEHPRDGFAQAMSGLGKRSA